MQGTVGILNVGAGDTKLSFDPKNPAECIRSGRIVEDMIRRGYALLVRVPGKKGKPDTYARAKGFDPNTCEYIIADLDPVAAEKADQEEAKHAESSQGETAEQDAGSAAASSGRHATRATRARTSNVPAASTHAVAVSRSAGG